MDTAKRDFKNALSNKYTAHSLAAMKSKLNSIVQQYNTTLKEIKADDQTVDRALVDDFFTIKQQVSNIYNGMRSDRIGGKNTPTTRSLDSPPPLRTDQQSPNRSCCGMTNNPNSMWSGIRGSWNGSWNGRVTREEMVGGERAAAARDATTVMGPVFSNDMCTRYNGPNAPLPTTRLAAAQCAAMGRAIDSQPMGEYVARTVIGLSPEARAEKQFQQQLAQNPTLAQQFQQQQRGRVFPRRKCINSSFSNETNQPQFRDNADIVLMQSDNGGMLPVNNAYIYDRNSIPGCNTRGLQSAMAMDFTDEQFTQRNIPVMQSVVSQAPAQPQQAPGLPVWTGLGASSGSLNNPVNPVWTPVARKYMD